jgi:diguanylate cyclase (GGDEF)-like protein/PAS domain S-box-containing protein
MIEQFAAIASEIARAPDDESLRQIVDGAALRIFGEGQLRLVARTLGAAGAIPVVCDGRPDEYLHAEGLDGHTAAPLLLQALADLLSARLTAIVQLSRSTGMQQGLSMDRAYFEQLFAASPEAIVVLDSQDRIVRLNRAFEQLFGYTEPEAEGRTVNDLIVPPESREEATALTDRVARGELIREEAVRRRKDGSQLHVMILATPILVEGDQVAVYGLYRDITQQKETEEALRRLSTTDELTGLYNRRGFFLVAEQQRKVATRKKAELLLLFIDIDDFKRVNDLYGHLEGDQVLADMGQLLRSCYRDSDILARVSETEDVVARMGGDEFVVLAIDAGEDGDRILVTRLREKLAIYNEERRAPYRVSLSVGAVRVPPDPANTVDAILAAADRLMYQDKRGLMRL